MQRGLKVLVVDDDEAIGEMVEWALVEEGHNVCKASNGAVALELVKREQPDLILLDMRMPVMDGWQFAKAFRQMPHRPTPIVVMTAARDAANRAGEIAAEGFLAKPFDIEELIDVVQRYLPVEN